MKMHSSIMHHTKGYDKKIGFSLEVKNLLSLTKPVNEKDSFSSFYNAANKGYLLFDDNWLLKIAPPSLIEGSL